ncbi:panl-3 [Pristionchus pacificus]|uniref:PAN2-PAN3 deadenylation complex subunit PAN3 n=1 Tax=Pristionchus pacificus TaxID=54126 RepID=A0A2A6CI30_PRIPA|nr:panl-3 [Pristionchus pacificus]|eukprot:PDM77799.1 panl-3 [Pristionchus pacificus]
MQHDSGYDQLNPGSRLHKYLGAASPSRPVPATTSMSPMSVNVPAFIPNFARLQLENGGGNGGAVGPPQQTSSQFQANAEEFVPQDHGGTVYFYRGGGQSAYESSGGGGSTGGLGSPIEQSDSSVLVELMNRQLAMKAKPEAALYPELPQAIEHMRDIVPLEAGSIKPSTGYQQSVYKATSARDGVHYVLRRVHAFRPINAKAFAPAESWKKLQAAHVVQLRECFATRAFGDNSLIFVYDYHPLSESLKERHFGRNGGVTMVDTMTGAKIMSSYSGSAGGAGLTGSGVPELLLWQYVVQLTAALRSIHATGLAARSIDISKVILMGKCKLLLSSCGVQDLVAPDHQQIQQQQSDDMVALGRLVLALATGNQNAGRREIVQQGLSIVGAHYSQDMKNLVTCLIGPSPRKTIADVMPMIGARFYHHIEALQSRVDLLENETARELENGRLFRLLCKMNTIVERPEHNMDSSWSETGDRFLIKLFRDYVFHQVTDQGKPWMDMAHIVSCMNKLDAGVAEKIELVSRDQDSVIIVSFGDLRRCIDAAFAELSATTVTARGTPNNQRHH